MHSHYSEEVIFSPTLVYLKLVHPLNHMLMFSLRSIIHACSIGQDESDGFHTPAGEQHMCAVYPQNTGTRLRILQDEHEVSVDKTVK